MNDTTFQSDGEIAFVPVVVNAKPPKHGTGGQTMYDELVKRLHSYSENCVAYKLDADFADAVQQAARHERDIKDALYTPTPSCSFKAEEGE